MEPSEIVYLTRDALRVRHLAASTEEAYIHRVRRFILYHNKRHPKELSQREVEAFLTYLAVDLQRFLVHAEPGTVSHALSVIMSQITPRTLC